MVDPRIHPEIQPQQPPVAPPAPIPTIGQIAAVVQDLANGMTALNGRVQTAQAAGRLFKASTLQFPEFDGNPNRVEDYLFALGEVESIIGGASSDAEKLVMAGTRLTGKAAAFYKYARCRADPPPIKTFESFKLEIKTHFMGVDSVEIARDRLDKARMRPGEPADKYTAYVTDLFLKIPKMTEEEEMHRYKSGLTKELQLEVAKDKPATLSDMTKLVQTIDRIGRGAAGRDRSYNGPTPMDLSAMDNRASGSSSDPNGPRCWRCDKPGHYKQQCKATVLGPCAKCGSLKHITKNHPPPGGWPKRRLTAMEMEPETEAEETDQTE